ncbi:MAG TPA: NAD(P)H:quinone oxidoreductase [Trueperaceae bacterium]
MSKTKLAVIYYSTYGTNYDMAKIAADAAEEAGAAVRLRKTPETAPRQVVEGQEGWLAQEKRTADVPQVTTDDMIWADAYLFSSPTRYGVPASQMRAFIDTLGPLWQEGKLANKAVSAMTSAMNPHGGQETTLLSLYTTFMHWGAVLVPPGYTDESVFASGGNPYGTSVTAGKGITDEDRKAIIHQTNRLLEVAASLRSEARIDRQAA